MMNVLKNIRASLTVLVLCILHVSCDVHEFPSPDLEHDVLLVLSFDRNLPEYKTVEVETKASDNPDDYDTRHVVQVYRADDNGKFDRTVFRRMTFFHHDVGIAEDSLKFTLPAGEYRFIVWSDHVLEGGGDLFYDTSQFEEIVLQGDHVGCNDLRDAFRGTDETEVVSGMKTVSDVMMERPMAKYSFIATDFEIFRTKVLEMMAAKAEAARKEAESKGIDTKDYDTKTVNLEDYKVVFSYTGFMPSAYNLYTKKPADASTGVSFETRMSQLDENHAELGFDYLFVNGNEASVNVSITTYDPDGNVMARSPSIVVPVVRSRHTIVKGSFLTAVASGSVGIVPGFDGDFNMEIK